MDEVVVQKLKERYSNVHPSIFNRSCSYAKTPGDLFDILEDIPKVYPIIWDNSKRKWVTVSNISDFDLKKVSDLKE